MVNSGCTSSKMNVCKNSNADSSKLNNPISDNKTDNSSKDLQNNQNQDTSEVIITYCYKPVFNEESEKDSNKSIAPDSLAIVTVDIESVTMCYAMATTTTFPKNDISPFTSNSIPPDFNGENIYRINELASNIRRTKETENISGTIFVQFTIMKDGTIRNVRIQKGLHPMLDEEIVKAVRKMHSWVWPINYTPDSDIEYVVPIQILSNEN
jgi:TonB family protein